jgi:hypothetical protein
MFRICVQGLVGPKCMSFFLFYFNLQNGSPVAACVVVQKNAKTLVMVQDSVVLGCLG